MKKLFKKEISNELTVAIGRSYWRLRRIFAIIGIFTMLGSLLPNIQKTYAYTVPEEDTTFNNLDDSVVYPTTTDEDYDVRLVDIIGEETSMRTEFTKTFQKYDGSYIVALYDQAVHYKQDGKWVDINNSLKFDDSNNIYENTDNSFKVKFPKTIDSNKDIKLSMDDYSISWSLIDINKTSISFTDSAKSNNIKELTNINQIINYYNILDGVDLQYEIYGSQLKENITLNSYSKDFSISFEYNVKNLTLEKLDGSFYFVNGENDIIFNFSNLFALDSDGDITSLLNINVENKKKDQYIVTISIDDEWAKSAKYPVVIDPSISLPNSGYIRDTYLVSTSSNSYYDSPQIFCGNFLVWNYLGYLNFTVPSYLQDYDIIYSTLYLTRYSGTGTLYLHDLPNYISDMSSMSWSTKPTAEDSLVDFAEINSYTDTYQFDITSSVKNWNDAGLTYMPGFELSTDGNLIKFNSIDSINVSPSIEIGFINSNGMKSYWTYNSQDISHAGTGYISDYTQELYFVRNDISFQTDLQSISLSFAFSNNMATSGTSNIGYGTGWNINYNLQIYDDSESAPYYTVDYTGNTVYYYPDSCGTSYVSDENYTYSCFIADDGSGSKLVHKNAFESTLLSVFIVGKDNTIYNFSLSYHDLTSISYPNSNITISVVRDSANRKKIDYIIDSIGNIIDLSYVSGNLSTVLLQKKINDTTFKSLEKVYYTYSSNWLSNVYYLSDYITYQDFTLNIYDLSNVDYIVQYTKYSTTNLLFTANVLYVNSEDGTSSLGEKIKYYYYSTINPKINYFESYFGTTKYSQVNYDNVENQTMITDHLGNFVLYSFDNYGHTVNMIDKNANALYYDYLDIFINDSTYVNGHPNYALNNTVVNNSSPEQMVYSPISNYSFETGTNGWYTYSDNGAEYLDGYDTYSSGIHSLLVEIQNNESGYASQSIVLDKGIYTISVDVMNSNAGTGSVSIEVGSLSQNVISNPNWQTFEFTIVADNDDTSVLIKLISSMVGNVYFDNVTIHKDFSTSLVNIIDNPSFEFGLTNNWILDYGSNYHVYQINDSTGALDTLYEEVLGDTAIGLNGTIYTKVYINSINSVSENSGSIFVGGWANRYSAPPINNANIVEGKSFRMVVLQYDYTGNKISSNPNYINFNLSYDNWQYAYGQIDLYDNCYSILVGFQYEGEGEVIFDGINVFYNESKTSITYDDYGRVTEVDKGDGTVYTYSYLAGDPELNMIPNIITDQNGHSITIDSIQNQVTAIKMGNVKSSPTYNSSGQMTKYTLKNDSGTITYFSMSTSYIDFNQYIGSTTNEYGNTTTYYTNILNGLLSGIKNSKNEMTNFEYYDDGVLKRVSIDNSVGTEMASVEYFYDEFNNLVQIKKDDDFSYFIEYDDLGRISSIYVNNNLLMSYDYYINTYETSAISEQNYANGDSLKFIYDDESALLESIQFRGSGQTYTTRYEYQYDDYGRVIIFHDIVNNSFEYYSYNSQGKIESVDFSNGNSYFYSYDESGNVTALELKINNLTSTINYFDNESISNTDLYDKTTYVSLDNISIERDYQYETNALDRLQSIYLTMDSFSIKQNFVYSGYTTRINQITYEINGSGVDYKYVYYYDSVGNITKEYYYEGTSLKLYRNFEYDALNQLIVEDSRDYNVSSSTTLTATNYTKFYHYDSKGNRTDVKTYLYAQNETIPVSIPSYLYSDSGAFSADMLYNGIYDYQDTYVLSIGQTPTLSFLYYDQFDTGHEYPIFGMTTTLTYSNLNTSVAGYYYQSYQATYDDYYDIYFRIVFKVGNPQPTIVIPQEHIHYNYASDWEDQLISFGEIDYINGVAQSEATLQSYTYDQTGNPTYITNFKYNGTVYYGASLSWDGRQLTSITIMSGTSNPSYLIRYSYNDEGYRTEKKLYTFSGYSAYLTQTVKYTIVSNKVVYETNGVYGILYTYDYDGTLISFNYDNNVNDAYSGVEYFYMRNQFGDITHITDSSGNVIVHYVYDAYGNIVTTDYALGYSSIASINAYKYRGYRYDSEINMYYLNSRYYNPQVGRFISSDGMLGQLADVLSTNMYTYCNNNPVMFSDISGYAPEWLNKMLIAAGIVATIAVITVIIVATAGTGTLAAAIALGALKGAAIGYLTGAAIGAGIGYLATGTLDGALTGMADGALTGAITGAITGGISGGIKYIRASRLLNSLNANALDSGYDCAEIAEDLQRLNKGRGSILTFKSKFGNIINVMEKGKVEEYIYHSVYKYGHYIIDPRYGQLSTVGQYISMLSKLNPLGIVF